MQTHSVHRRAFLRGAVSLAGFSALGALVACGAPPEAPSTPSPAPTAASAQPTATTAATTQPATSPTPAGQATTAPTPANKPVAKVSGKVIFWHGRGTSGDQYDWIMRWVRAFGQANSSVQVDTSGVVFTELEPKVVAATAAGTPPDLVADLARGTVPNRAIKQQIQSLSDLIRRDNINVNELFYKSTVDECSWDGKLYGLPFNGTVVIHFWNKDLFREVGLDPEKPAQNWDQLWDYANRLDVKGSDGKYTRFGFYPLYGFNWFLAMAWGNGAEFVIGEGRERRVRLNNPEAIETLEYWVRYAQKYTVEGWTAFTSGLGTQDAFVTKKLGQVNNGIQWIRNVYGKNPDVHFGTSVVPYQKQPATLAAGGDLEIPVGAKNLDGAWELAKFLLRPECQAEQLTIFSAVPGTKTGFALGEKNSPDPNWEAANRAMETSRYVEYVEGIANWRGIIERHVAAAMQLKETPKQALDTAQAEAEQELANYRRTKGQ